MHAVNELMLLLEQSGAQPEWVGLKYRITQV